MNTTIERKQQASFRLRASLMERLRAEARYEHRSLTDLVEILLDEALKHRSNPETMVAIEEARSGKYAGTIDASSFESFMKSINEIE